VDIEQMLSTLGTMFSVRARVPAIVKNVKPPARGRVPVTVNKDKPPSSVCACRGRTSRRCGGCRRPIPLDQPRLRKHTRLRCDPTRRRS
jgi:hypothetical protein